MALRMGLQVREMALRMGLSWEKMYGVLFINILELTCFTIWNPTTTVSRRPLLTLRDDLTWIDTSAHRVGQEEPVTLPHHLVQTETPGWMCAKSIFEFPPGEQFLVECDIQTLLNRDNTWNKWFCKRIQISNLVRWTAAGWPLLSNPQIPGDPGVFWVILSRGLIWIPGGFQGSPGASKEAFYKILIDFT